MLMHTLDSVQAILQAWEDIADELAETLDDLIDWRMFYKL